MAKKTTTQRKQKARKASSRRAPHQPLDAQRWAGYGEVIPDRRMKDRRQSVSGNKADSKRTPGGTKDSAKS